MKELKDKSNDELILDIKNLQAQLLTQTEKTTFLQDCNTLPGDRFALIFGNEVNGVNQAAINASDVVLEIPQFGTKHSLNVSVCAGVVLWEFTKKYI